MKKVFVTIVGLMFCAGLVTLNAAGKRELTPEQQKEKQALLDKYDADKNGKLNAEERAKMTQEDKEKLAKLGGGAKRNQAK